MRKQWVSGSVIAQIEITYKREVSAWQVYPVAMNDFRLVRYGDLSLGPDVVAPETVEAYPMKTRVEAENIIKLKAWEAAILKAFTVERIVRAAVTTGEGVWSVPPPGRHRQVLDEMIASGLSPNVLGSPSAQGFLTSSGRFVDRIDAKQIARDAGQIDTTEHEELFSEDLW